MGFRRCGLGPIFHVGDAVDGEPYAVWGEGRIRLIVHGVPVEIWKFEAVGPGLGLGVLTQLSSQLSFGS